jgi:hypothetical protein
MTNNAINAESDFVTRASPRIKPRKRGQRVSVYAASSLIRRSSVVIHHLST